MAALLERLNVAFNDDPQMDEYALVPVASHELFGAEGTQDLGCIAQQQKLALSIEGALVLYLHASQVMRRATADGNATEALASSRAVLLCSADSVSAWQCREKFDAAHLNPEAELLFSTLLLRTNHKSGESWSRRRALLGQMLEDAEDEERQRLLSQELALLEELAKRYDHHYYAWNHWAWLDRKSLEVLPKTGGPTDVASFHMDFPKLAFATPSHYGLYHHRLVRLHRQMNDGFAVSEFQALPGGLLVPSAFMEEWSLAQKLLETFPHLEAPWAFRAQVFALAAEAAAQEVQMAEVRRGEPQDKIEKVAEFWKFEVDFAKKLTEQEDSRRWALRFQVHVLQELGFFLLEAADHFAEDAVKVVQRDAQVALEELIQLEADVPVVLQSIAKDLEEKKQQGYSSPKAPTKTAENQQIFSCRSRCCSFC